MSNILTELLNYIPESERKDYEENINKLEIPISKLSKNDLKEMNKYFNSKRDMIDNTMKTFYDNNKKYLEYFDIDWDLISVIIGFIIDDLIFAENKMGDRKYVNYSDNETLFDYYSKIHTFTNDARNKKEKRGVKPESESKVESKVEPSPYVDNEKPNPNINNPNIGNANINNKCNLRESSVIIGVIILLIILLISGVILAIINSEYLPLFIVTIPSCIGACCLYTIYKEN
jgi:hypothetical protein